MLTIIIHIGGPKCGSTSLQRYLTYRNTLFDAQAKKLLYCVIQADGSVIHGDQINHAVKKYEPLAFSSVPIPIGHNEALRFKKAFEAIANLANENTIPIVSCEAWGEWGSFFISHKIFSNLGHIYFKVVQFVRPQIEWVNSAWWQWGAWSDLSIEEWVRQYALNTCDWYKIADSWSHLIPNGEVRVIESSSHKLVSNVVGSFLQYANAFSSEEDYSDFFSNVTAPYALINFFSRNRFFRPSQHEAEIEFLLKQKVIFSGKKAPFVVGAKLQEYIYENFRENNLKLKQFFLDVDYDSFIVNKKWFPLAFVDGEQMIVDERVDNDALIADLIKAIAIISKR